MPNKPIPCSPFKTNAQFTITALCIWIENETSEKLQTFYIIPVVMAICTQLRIVAPNKDKNQVKM